VDGLKSHINELAELMDEYKLSQAEMAGEGWRVAFKRRSTQLATVTLSEGAALSNPADETTAEEAEAAPIVKGIPVSSPMTGIFYTASSPTSPAFAREGEPVTAGQVVGLIEAMKVFNEITAPISGTVTKVIATSGQLVNPGDPLLYIG
jgi:acetyl-CoA carboxylase biotin carboxyl carrier protein